MHRKRAFDKNITKITVKENISNQDYVRSCLPYAESFWVRCTNWLGSAVTSDSLLRPFFNSSGPGALTRPRLIVKGDINCLSSKTNGTSNISENGYASIMTTTSTKRNARACKQNKLNVKKLERSQTVGPQRIAKILYSSQYQSARRTR